MQKNKKDFTGWLVTIVLPCFIPCIFTCLLYFAKDGTFGVGKIIYDGEMVLAAFLLILPIIISQIDKKNTEGKTTLLILFYAFCEVCTYASIRTSDQHSFATSFVSIVFILLSLCISYSKHST